MKYVQQSEGCWTWTGRSTTGGQIDRGLFHLDGRMHVAARIAYVLWRGEIPEGLHVLHTCDNGMRVNPKHLFLGTRRDNMQDKIRKGRANREHLVGEGCSWTKLTRQQVEEIRMAYEPPNYPGQKGNRVTMKILAERFGVSRAQIGYIIRGESWR